MSSAFIRSTIEVRHASFSPFEAAALSTIAATSTLPIGAAGADDDPEVAGVAPLADALPAGPPPLAGVALAWLPKIAPMIFPKILIACSQSNEDKNPVNVRTALPVGQGSQARSPATLVTLNLVANAAPGRRNHCGRPQ